MGMMDIEGIKRIIPHREPFLFLDEVVDVNDERLIAKRTIRADEPQFEGHYPGNPIMPGVLLCEATFQAAGIFLNHKFADEKMAEATPILVRITDARFKQMVKPGDTVEIEVSYKEAVSRFHFLKGIVRKAGKVAMTVEFAIAMIHES